MQTTLKQRLAIYLDGTWNTEDDSTNILNAYHSTVEGLVQEPNKEDFIQKRYYDRGVGTGMFESIRGGGYGKGLEKNVREAYHWLVDNYNDGDEIYIFGFSRGAYTARSLVGLIASCGLVRRGAPIMISQLWNGYAFISNNRGIKDYEWWKEELTKDKNKELFRRITAIRYRKEDEPLINHSEALIEKWSRRVDITYMGIYDTVGAMGIHALGIPGLSSKLAANHNMNPTSLIKQCRHALAIDEHRSSFRITPILNYVKNRPKSGDNYLEGQQLRDNITEHQDNIEQRWYPGAHSNIGGGYANNVLLLRPLEWIMKGANDGKNTNLVITQLHSVLNPSYAEELEKKDIRDSYAELAGFVYPHIIRSKRYFRPIDPGDDVRSGYTLRSVNEIIDETALNKMSKDKSYAPPNLITHLKKNATNEEEKKKLAELDTPHIWPGEMLSYTGEISFIDSIKARFWLIVWSVFAAFGLMKLVQFFWIEPLQFYKYTVPALAAIFVLVDWLEHRLVLARIKDSKAVRIDVYWNLIYWLALLGNLSFFVAAFAGLYAILFQTESFNFSFQGIVDYLNEIAMMCNDSTVLATILFSLVTIVLVDLFRKSLKFDVAPEKLVIHPERLNPSESPRKTNQIYMGAMFIIGFGCSAYIITRIWDQVPDFTFNDSISEVMLLFFILIFAFLSLIDWVGKPMGKSMANLDTVVMMQTAFSATQLKKLMNSWLYDMCRNWSSNDDIKLLNKHGFDYELKKSDCDNEADYDKEIDKRKTVAWIRTRKVLRTALWRDIVGFVPFYTFIFGVILCIGTSLFCANGSEMACSKVFGKIPWWLFLIVVVAVSDQIENTIHLNHIKSFPKKSISNGMVWLGMFFTTIKMIGFVIAALLSLVAVLYVVTIILTNVGNWKWMIAIVLIYITLFSVVGMIIKRIKKILSDR